MPQAERQIRRRLLIRSIEYAILRRVLVRPHVQMESSLDGRDRSLNLDFHAIARAADDSKPVGLGKANHRIIVLLGRAEPLRELLHAKKVPVVETGRIVDIAEKTLQACPIA